MISEAKPHDKLKNKGLVLMNGSIHVTFSNLIFVRLTFTANLLLRIRSLHIGSVKSLAGAQQRCL